ncbi:hypothetical protein HELRODRAFT_184246 [Helobdella robusta]|uniref:Uncharacterized protein n=1 Tax=Helobdella robusta TaxID=6412 RepID=T1FKU5_HELRO|nr:hypothetical protein HELRODRAFT_184246 [Helobdella robusta]ESO04151.1 hypothetical protein HELRODRAFT_184246 [Helobdella robusta]
MALELPLWRPPTDGIRHNFEKNINIKDRILESPPWYLATADSQHTPSEPYRCKNPINGVLASTIVFSKAKISFERYQIFITFIPQVHSTTNLQRSYCLFFSIAYKPWHKSSGFSSAVDYYAQNKAQTPKKLLEAEKFAYFIFFI